MTQLPPWLKPSIPETLEVNPDNIPKELKDSPRWLVWKAVLKEDGKITKPPYRAKDPRIPASTNNPAHLTDFYTAYNCYKEQGSAYGIAGIGYVADPKADLVFVDLDDCVINGEPDTDTQVVINAFCSYAEASPSGKGIRIIARGNIPHDFTNHKLGREMYGGGGTRYLTITGQVLDSLETIEDAQEAISHYHQQWDTHKARGQVDINVSEPVNDVDLSRCSESTLSLIHGKTIGSYESRSEAVLGAAMDLIRAGYSDSEIASILTNPEYPIASKALENRLGDVQSAKQWVAKYTLPEAKSRVASEPQAVSFTLGDRQEGLEQKISRQPIGPSGPDLHNPPGLVGLIAKEMLNNAIRPQEMFAVSGALMAVSIASQNYYRCAYMGGSINLYMVQVGSTSSGKDAPRKAIKSLLSEIQLSHLVPESVASGAALLRSLSRNTTLGYMPDEFGLMLQTAINDRGSVHSKDMVSELMRLYSLGNSLHTGKKYANYDDNIDEIRRPFVSMLGSTTPDELTSAISVTQVNNGFLNRILYIEAEHEKPPKQRRPQQEFSSELFRRLEALTASFGNIPASVRAPEMIYFTSGAEQVLDDFDDLCDERHTGEFGPIWNRAHENAIRVAGVLAVGMGGQPNVTAELAKWAIGFVEWCVQNMIKHLEENMAGSQFEADAKRVLKYISHAKKYVGDKRFGKYCTQDVMPRGLLVRLMHMPSRQLDQVIDHLVEGQHIERGEAKENEKQRPVAIYRVLK